MSNVPNITYEDIYNRLLAQLPQWFGNQKYSQPTQGIAPTPNDTTNFNKVIWAYIITAFNGYYQLQYDWLQMRIGQYELNNDSHWPISIPNDYPFNPDVISTNPFANALIKPITPAYPIAFSDNLDLIAKDFFGNGLNRRAGESDNSYRNRILSNVMRLKATRPAMLSALINLVTPAFVAAGIPIVNPEIYEEWYPLDNGGYNDYQALAYNTIGSYGSGSNPYTCTIVVFLPSANGLGNHPGLSTYGDSITWGAGFGDPSITEDTPSGDIPPQWYGSDSLLVSYVTESDIVTLINLTKVLGTVCNLIISYLN